MSPRDKVYAHPLDGESPSPMYDALNTNLPHVSLISSAPH
jgi:hypothetical protein